MPRYFSAIRSSLLSCLGRAVAEVAPRLRVQILGKRLGQPIGERLDDDRGVVVVLRLEAADEIVDAVPRGDREGADVIDDRRCSTGATKSASERFGLSSAMTSCWRSIGKRAISGTGTSGRVPSRWWLVQDDVVAVAVRRPEAVDAARAEELAADDAVEQRLRRARRGRAPRRRVAGGRGSQGSGPSAPTRRRRTSSRCTGRGRRDRRRRCARR